VSPCSAGPDDIFRAKAKKYMDKPMEGTAKYIPKDHSRRKEKITVSSNFFVSRAVAPDRVR
jgi:hypothetical protein